jgi:hypothetical protein
MWLYKKTCKILYKNYSFIKKMWLLITNINKKSLRIGNRVAKKNPDENDLEPIYTILSINYPESDEIKLEIKHSGESREERIILMEELISQNWVLNFNH